MKSIAKGFVMCFLSAAGTQAGWFFADTNPEEQKPVAFDSTNHHFDEASNVIDDYDDS